MDDLSDGGDAPVMEPVAEPVAADPAPAPAAPATEPETITKWREGKEKRLAEQTAAESKAVADLEAQAKKELEEWDAKYQAKLKATSDKNAEGEKVFVSKMDAKDSANPWEKVAFVVDFNKAKTPGGKDTSKMKSLLIRLKQEGLLNRA